MISVKTLKDISFETGFRADTIERVIRLIDVMSELSEDEDVGPLTALKGGTALNLFHFNLDRLSVDIDLNYVGAHDGAMPMEARTAISADILAIMKRLGYEAQRMPNEQHAGGKWRFRYPSAFGQRGTLEIDLNFMYRAPLFGTSTVDSISLGGYQAKGIQLVNLYEIAAGKLVALANREASRDIFDAWRLAKRTDLDWVKVKNAMVVMGACARTQDWRVANIENYAYDLNEVQSKLLTCVPGNVTAEAGGTSAWIDNMVTETREKLGHLYELEDSHLAFLDKLYDEGEIDPSLLNADDSFRMQVSLFPSLAWKAQNIRKHLAGVSSGPRVR